MRPLDMGVTCLVGCFNEAAGADPADANGRRAMTDMGDWLQ